MEYCSNGRLKERKIDTTTVQNPFQTCQMTLLNSTNIALGRLWFPIVQKYPLLAPLALSQSATVHL